MEENNYSGIDKRTNCYVFTTKQSLIDFYSQIIPEDKLKNFIKEIEADPFIKRKGQEKLEKLQKLKKLEWRLNKIIEKNPDVLKED